LEIHSRALVSIRMLGAERHGIWTVPGRAEKRPIANHGSDGTRQACVSVVPLGGPLSRLAYPSVVLPPANIDEELEIGVKAFVNPGHRLR
jgi:hypothetical protein